MSEILSIIFVPPTQKEFTPGFGPDFENTEEGDYRQFYRDRDRDRDNIPQGSFSSLGVDSENGEYEKRPSELRNSENTVLFSESDLIDLFTKVEAKSSFLRQLDEKRCRDGSLSAEGFSAMAVIMKVIC